MKCFGLNVTNSIHSAITVKDTKKCKYLYMLIIMIINLGTIVLSPPYCALQWGQFIDY